MEITWGIVRYPSASAAGKLQSISYNPIWFAAGVAKFKVQDIKMVGKAKPWRSINCALQRDTGHGVEGKKGHIVTRVGARLGLWRVGMGDQPKLAFDWPTQKVDNVIGCTEFSVQIFV